MSDAGGELRPLIADLAVARDRPVALTIAASADLVVALEGRDLPPNVVLLVERLRALLVNLELRLEQSMARDAAARAVAERTTRGVFDAANAP